MMKARTFYVFRFDWTDRIAHLSATVRLEIHEAAARYARNGSLPEMSKEAEEAFNEYLLPDFRRREKAAAYRAKAKARKAEDTKAENKKEEAESTAPKDIAESSPVKAESESAVISPDSVPAQENPAPKLSRSQRRRLRRRKKLLRESRKMVEMRSESGPVTIDSSPAQEHEQADRDKKFRGCDSRFLSGD